MQETNLGILLADFQNGTTKPSLKNYKTTLETGLKILELASYDLPVLNDIFKYIKVLTICLQKWNPI